MIEKEQLGFLVKALETIALEIAESNRLRHKLMVTQDSLNATAAALTAAVNAIVPLLSGSTPDALVTSLQSAVAAQTAALVAATPAPAPAPAS